MKVEIELHKNDMLFLSFAILIVSLTIGYFIYRESSIRQMLVEQALPQNYGKGVIDSVDKFRSKSK